MSDLHVQYLTSGRTRLCLAGYRLRRILSADLILDLAGAVAVLPEPAEFHLVIACQPGAGYALPVFDQGLIAVGRGRTRATAKRHCLRAADDLHKIFAAVLDYAEFEPVSDEASLARLTAPLGYRSVTELGRRHEMVRIGSRPGADPAIKGFGPPAKAHKAGRAPMIKFPHLFPWTPNDDAWWRLVDVMARESGLIGAATCLRAPALDGCTATLGAFRLPIDDEYPPKAKCEHAVNHKPKGSICRTQISKLIFSGRAAKTPASSVNC